MTDGLSVPGLSEADLAELLRLDAEGAAPPRPWARSVGDGGFPAVRDAEGVPVVYDRSGAIDLTLACVNCLRPLLSALLDAQRLVEVMANDGQPAYELGRSVGRGEAVAAFDAETRLWGGALQDRVRDALVRSGAHARLPLDQARAENERLREALRGVLKYPAVAGTPLAAEIHEALAGGREDG